MPGWDDFYKEYEQPKINNITVGFSGIDPQQRSSGSGTNIDVTEQIANYIKKITIKIDSGNVDPDAVEPEEPYIPLKPSDIPHEELAGLLGGKLSEHYHFTADEWQKVKKIIALLYPDGATEPVIPGGSDDSGGGDDNPTPGGDDVDRFGGLPAANPPQWTLTRLPDGYTAVSGVHKMYYGKMHVNSNGEAPIGLLAFMDRGTAGWLLMCTDNLTTWQNKLTLDRALASSGIAQYMHVDTGKTTVYRHILYIMLPSDTKNRIYRVEQNNSLDYNTTSYVGTTTPYVAVAYSTALDIYIFISSGGNVARVKNYAVLTTTENRYLTCGITVNPGCAVWVPTAQHFCVSGPDGTATSNDGITWVKHTSAPHNLKDLTWRDDLADGACLFAWREEDRKFYASPDGATWTEAGNLPTTDQISTIAAVDYNPDLQWYCAIGGANRHAYFSKDLKTWRSTNVVTEYATEVNMGSVIWMPSTKKYVLMPTSGDKFYTFSPDDWK